MISLYVGSTSGYTGKTLITLVSVTVLYQDRLKIGYMKPVGNLNQVKVNDGLLTMMHGAYSRALDMKDPLADICPVVLTQELEVNSYRKEIKGLMAKVVEVV